MKQTICFILGMVFTFQICFLDAAYRKPRQSVLWKPSFGTTINWNSPQAQGLIAAYFMNAGGGTTIYDASRNNNNGTLISGPTWGFGKFGSAIKFDGSSQYIRITDNAIQRPAHITISCWFNLNSSPTFADLVSKAYNGPPWTSPYVAYLIRVNSLSTIETDVGNGTTYSSFTPSFSLSLNVWYQMAMTYDGTTVTAYINGISVGTSSTVSGNIGYGTNVDTIIGADYGSSPVADFFPGYIDDVRIYNRALSASEILNYFVAPYELFNSPKMDITRSSPIVPFVPQPRVPTIFYKSTLDNGAYQ